MTLQRPIWMQAGGADPTFEYAAIELRNAHSALVSQEGVFSGLEVTQRGAGANFSVDVSAGYAVVTGDDVADQGAYIVHSDAVYNVVIPAAPASGSRTHRVIAQIQDELHEGTYSTYDWDIVVQEDTGSGTPALTDSAIPLATVTVTSATVSITDSEITDARIRAQLHTSLMETVASSAARPAVPVERQLIWRSDNNYYESYDGSAWQVLNPNPPFAQLLRTTDQSISTSTFTAVAWNAEDEDTHAGHSTVTNNSRYTAQVAGVYLCTATIPFAADATGLRSVNFRVNGTTTYTGPRLPATSTGTTSYEASRLIRLAVGDYVECVVWQNSGGSLAVDFDLNIGPLFDIAWVRA